MRRILVELMSARTYVKTLFEKPWLRFNEAESLSFIIGGLSSACRIQQSRYLVIRPEEGLNRRQMHYRIIQNSLS